MGIQKNIYYRNNYVDEKLIEDISENFLIEKYNTSDKKLNILFLGRIEKQKGVYEAINSYKLAKNKINSISMTIAGDGSEIENVRQYILKNNIYNINIVGHITGAEKNQHF